MKCLLKSSVLLFALSCLAHGAGAEPPATAQRAGSAVRTIVVGGETLVMKGERLIARLTDEQSTHYFYKEGRLSNVYRSDGRFASYYYDADKRLERIEFSDGQVQRAVYRAGVLVSLDSSSGQRMIMAPAPDKPVAAAGKEGQLKSAAPPGAGTAALSAPDALNKKLLAIVGWEEKSWECRLAPDERTICIGRGGGGGGGDSGGDSGGGSGGAPYGGPGWTPGDGAPSGGGSHGGGDGGGGNGDGYGGGPRYPTNLPTRMSCLSAASETFEIMRDEVCTMVRDPTICMEQNLLLFQQLWQECIARFPH